MDVSVFDLFKIGLGPSSSHTVGPMKAALLFCERLVDFGVAARVATVRVSLHGSLAHTGRGHGTDTAIVLGLRGERPDTVDTDAAPGLVDYVHQHPRHLSADVPGSTMRCAARTGEAQRRAARHGWAPEGTMDLQGHPKVLWSTLEVPGVLCLTA